jgi:hypothetical protein
LHAVSILHAVLYSYCDNHTRQRYPLSLRLLYQFHVCAVPKYRSPLRRTCTSTSTRTVCCTTRTSCRIPPRLSVPADPIRPTLRTLFPCTDKLNGFLMIIEMQATSQLATRRSAPAHIFPLVGNPTGTSGTPLLNPGRPRRRYRSIPGARPTGIVSSGGWGRWSPSSCGGLSGAPGGHGDTT